MHTILITNDDGIMADGLYRLAKEAQHFGKVSSLRPMVSAVRRRTVSRFTVQLTHSPTHTR